MSKLPYFCCNLPGCQDSVAFITFFFFSMKPSYGVKNAMLCAGGQGMSLSPTLPADRIFKFSSA